MGTTYNFDELKKNYRNPEFKVAGFDEFNQAREIDVANYINIINNTRGSRYVSQLQTITRAELIAGLFHGQTLPSFHEQQRAIANWMKAEEAYYYTGNSKKNAYRRGQELNKRYVILEKPVV